jgi:protein-tyrosine-phosphatase
MPPQHRKVRVLFVCVGNACRSPIAEAIARHIAGDIIECSSAGLYPLGRIPETTEQTLRANGYTLKGLSSKQLCRAAVDHADLIINMSGRSLENLFLSPRSTADAPLKRKIENWNVQDPYGEDPAIYQRILEELESRVLLLAARLRDRHRAAHA